MEPKSLAKKPESLFYQVHVPQVRSVMHTDPKNQGGKVKPRIV